MRMLSSIRVTDSRPTIAADLGRHIFWVLWQCIRVPLFLLLVTLEPVVTFVLGSPALLGVLTALFWKFLGPPHFPFVLVISISLGLQLALILYHQWHHMREHEQPRLTTHLDPHPSLRTSSPRHQARGQRHRRSRKAKALTSMPGIRNG